MFNIFKSVLEPSPPIKYYKVELDDFIFEYTIKLTDSQGNIKIHILKDSIVESEHERPTVPPQARGYTRWYYKPVILKYTGVKRAIDVLYFLNSHNLIFEENGDYFSYNRDFIKTVEISKTSIPIKTITWRIEK